MLYDKVNKILLFVKNLLRLLYSEVWIVISLSEGYRCEVKHKQTLTLKSQKYYF